VNRTLPTGLEDQCWKAIHRGSKLELLPGHDPGTKLS